jgi:molecular chaperone HtpG
LHGVIDSPDIPLNVSRSSLQTDSNVRKISKHIAKKVADKLEELFKNERTEFETKWEDIKIFIEYGIISDEGFSERATSFCLLKNTEDKYYTFEEYKNLIGSQQTDKSEHLIYLYTTDKTQQHTFIEKAKNKGYDVLVFDSPIDAHFINYLEQKFEKSHFKRVDADVVEKLIEKDDKKEESKFSEEETKKLKELFENHLKDKAGFSVLIENLGKDEAPVLITQPEFMRRMKEMAKMGGGMDYMGMMPDSYNVVVNSNHPKVEPLVNVEPTDETKKTLSQMLDLALLSQGLLKGEELTNFIQRSYQFLV